MELMRKSVLRFLLVLSIVCTVFSYSNERVFERVFEVHKKNLAYLHESKPNLMILFSGTPGMGKTVVAKQLEERFHAVRLSSDDIRLILREQGVEEGLANAYLAWCAHKIFQTEPNHLFVFDKSIDRTFDIYSKFANDHHYPIFLIQMRVPRSVVEARIRSRGKDVKTILHQLDYAWKNYEDFGRSHVADFVFENDEATENSVEPLIQKINAQISIEVGCT
jgi:predicted kinase